MELSINSKATKELLEDSIVDFSKPFDVSKHTFNNDVTITEDKALSLNVSIDSLILEKKEQGFREVSRYHHPAVGLVVVMRQDYSLAE